MQTYDQLAARALLRQEGAQIPTALLEEASVAIGQMCPECGTTDTEDNGHSEYRCVECDHRWGFDCGERYGF